MTDIAVDETPVSTSPDAAADTPKVTPLTLLVGTIVRPMATFKQLRDANRSYWWFVLVVTVVMILAVTLAESSVTASRFANFTAGGGARTFGGQGTTGTGQGNFGAGAGTTGATNRGANTGGTGQRNANGFGGAGGAASGTTGAGTTGTGGTRTFQAPSPLLVIGLPVAGGIAVTLIDYGLRAVLVFLMSMVLGGKAAFKEVFRMAAWTTIPAAVRRVVQTAAVLLTGAPVAAGFSAALSAAEVRTLPIVNLLLSYVDIYTLWSALLLGIGAVITGKLSKGKAAFTVAIYICVSVVGILLFYSVSSAIGSALGGTGTRGGALPGGAGGAGGRITRPGG